MIVDTYNPRPQEPVNALHRLTLMRMEARREADKSYETFRRHAHSFFEPEPKTSFVSSLMSNLSVVMTGITVGRKLINMIRGLR